MGVIDGDHDANNVSLSYDIWQANDLPDDESLKEFELKPEMAMAIFRLMGGIPSDNRVKPEDISFEVDEQKVLNEWEMKMGHNITMSVCGVCGIRDYMADKDCEETPISHKRLQILVHSDGDLNKNFPARKEWQHLVTVDGTTYSMVPEAVNFEQKTVLVCNDCKICLKYALRSKKIPYTTIARYDPGMVPSYLPEMSLLETLSISKVMVFTPLVKLRLVHGSSEKALKGHVVAMPIDSAQVLTQEVNSLPRTDLSVNVGVTFNGRKNLWKTVKKIARNYAPLSMNFVNPFMWLVSLKSNGNPEYTDITIPMTDAEKEASRISLEEQLSAILEAANVTNSGLVEKLEKGIRAEVEDEDDGLDDLNINGVKISNVLLCTSQKTNQPLPLILSGVKDIIDINKASDDGKNEKRQHAIKIGDKLLNEYSNNHMLLSGAFPTLFPLGLTAESIGGGGTLKKNGTEANAIL